MCVLSSAYTLILTSGMIVAASARCLNGKHIKISFMLNVLNTIMIHVLHAM